jgi:glycosyltransferase involved in cell wall biosynthesis
MNEGISVCFVIKNGLINGYPFWESLESCLPIANEIVISDGNSVDKTYDALLKFKERYGDKVKLFKTNWERSGIGGCGEIISVISSETMAKCSCKWIYYLQADEIIHKDNYNILKDIASEKLGNYNSVCFRYSHFIGSWKPLPRGGAAYSEAIRMVRNMKEISLMGDAWTFKGVIHPVFDPNKIPKPIYHFGWVFPKNIDQKNVEQAKIYPSMPDYQRKASASAENIKKGYSQKNGFPKPEDYDDYPDSMRRLIGQFEYSLPLGIL